MCVVWAAVSRLLVQTMACSIRVEDSCNSMLGKGGRQLHFCSLYYRFPMSPTVQTIWMQLNICCSRKRAHTDVHISTWTYKDEHKLSHTLVLSHTAVFGRGGALRPARAGRGRAGPPPGWQPTATAGLLSRSGLRCYAGHGHSFSLSGSSGIVYFSLSLPHSLSLSLSF